MSVSRPLLVSARTEVIDDLLRLAAAAGVELEVACDCVAAHDSWLSAPIVIVDDQAVVDAEGIARLPRRDDVVLLGDDVDDATVWRRGLALRAEHVVFLPDADAWIVERLAVVRDGGGRPAPVVAVVGGRGGSGATTLAAALAMSAVGRRLRTMLVDLDPLGGGIDLSLGCEAEHGLRWPDLAQARGRLSGESLADALPRIGELPVLSWDRGSDIDVPFDAARAVLDAATRVSDLVVVDLPRAAGPAAVHVAARAAEVLLVVPAEVRAVASAERVLRTYGQLATSVRAVVRVPAPNGLPADVVCDVLSVGFAGELRTEPRLAQAADRGEPPGRRRRGPLAELCGRLLDELDVASRPSSPR